MLLDEVVALVALAVSSVVILADRDEAIARVVTQRLKRLLDQLFAHLPVCQAELGVTTARSLPEGLLPVGIPLGVTVKVLARGEKTVECVDEHPEAKVLPPPVSDVVGLVAAVVPKVGVKGRVTTRSLGTDGADVYLGRVAIVPRGKFLRGRGGRCDGRVGGKPHHAKGPLQKLVDSIQGATGTGPA